MRRNTSGHFECVSDPEKEAMTAPHEEPYKVEPWDDGDKIITGPTQHPGVLTNREAEFICPLLNAAFAAGEKKGFDVGVLDERFRLAREENLRLNLENLK